MKRISAKGHAKLSWKTELVDDAEGSFYMRVYPVLSQFRIDRDKSVTKQIAQEILAEIKASKQTGKVKVK